ncbi:RNA polymerase sigma factor [Polyangium mundeleinium]|uniref:Sigma-70 family RNA polymerase sigma factor n=1 Tax=Polyangium mundeleinium TaxID=2995306 RepID=A0ABT5EQZ8_9BACT|nr:sigma-70 family RNA polymerase sigma factor [Polyangium mundeleinium]MDC0744256.1 sigma-70 family RNA polymerase sigma factor [Polyangium mundeleinium]
MSAPMPMVEPRLSEPLADPELRRFLLDFVRRRVSPADADDIVQTVLCEALTAKNRPDDGAELRKYLLGIARHKVADAHRRTAREEVRDPPELVAGPPPVEEEALLRWAERQAPTTEEAKKTLTWMAREGEGEKLESIAEEEQVPAARVRQRVSRMRRWMKERWLAELAAVAALAVLAVVLWRVAQDAEDPEAILPLPDRVPAPSDTPLDRARALRADALWWCERGSYRICVEELDAARQLDPTGDEAPEVQAAREQARRALTVPPPVPTSTKRDIKDVKGEIEEKAPEPKKVAPPPKPAPTSVKPKVDPELRDRGTENEKKAKPSSTKQRKKGDVDFLKK